jgi:hypothetical protein
MLLTRGPDALLHVKLANLWLLLAKKCLTAGLSVILPP